MKHERPEDLLEIIELVSRETESEIDTLELAVTHSVVRDIPSTDARLDRLREIAHHERSIREFACYLARGNFPGASA